MAGGFSAAMCARSTVMVAVVMALLIPARVSAAPAGTEPAPPSTEPAAPSTTEPPATPTTPAPAPAPTPTPDDTPTVLSADSWPVFYAGPAINALIASADPADISADVWDDHDGYTTAAAAPDDVFNDWLYEQAVRLLHRHRGDLDAVFADLAPAAAEVADGTVAGDGPAVRWRVRYEAVFTAPATPPYLPPVDRTEPLIRPIAFPVAGPVRFGNDWQACRDQCSRRHEGTDLIADKGQPLLAAVDGTVVKIRYTAGIAGNYIEIEGDDGWLYIYRHLNNDTPGSNDAAASPEWVNPPGVQEGVRVHAGQVVAYLGNSGNAERSVPHLHFEIRTPSRVSVNPYPSLLAARQRQQGMVAIGAWSTVYPNPGETLIDRDSVTEMDPRIAQVVLAAGETAALNSGAGSVITDAGEVWTFGPGTLITPDADAAGVPVAGTGINVDLIPDEWLTAPASPDASTEPPTVRRPRAGPI